LEVLAEVNRNNESFWKAMSHSLEVMQHSSEVMQQSLDVMQQSLEDLLGAAV
jgi:hypothetical protein